MSDTDINATVNVTEDIYADVDSTAMSAAVIDDGDSIAVPAEVDFGQTLDTELEDNDLIDVPVDESVGIAGDHRVLLHRDAANQHPMSAITGLNETIAGINTALSDRITQVEAETADLDVDMASALLRIGDLQDQVDGNITTWFYAAEPAMNLPPVALDPSNPHDTGWDTIDKKNAHRGDLYYNTLTGYAYRFAYADGDFGWMRITDTDVVKALADAARAQDTADSKRRVFYTTPYPPYDKGDLWVQGTSGDILVCNTSKAAGEAYDFADWAKASKYTDDTVANLAMASANGKNTVYHQASQPTGGTYKKGDTWFDTDDDYTMYTYDGSLWVKEQFGNEAIADLSITNGKIANATIEYGKIKSVDAGKITVGDLSANRIKASVITAVNNSTETSGGSSLKISADKVNIEGAAIFTSGRLSETSLDNAYDANGAAADALSDAKGYADDTAADALADAKTYADGAVSDKAGKSDAVARQQRIYYRKTASGAPSKNTTWLSTSGTGYDNWSLKVPQMTSGTTKYPYLYTAVQTQTVSQQAAGSTCTCSDVLLDDTTTVIDGGTIITGTVNANAVNASSGTFNTANIPNLDASKITAGDISADRMKVNSISAINGNTGSVQISASKVNITGTAVFNAVNSDASAKAAMLNSELEIGGTNLLRGTATQDISLGNSRDSVVETSDKFLGCTVFRSNTAWADIGFEFDKQLANTNKVKAGDTITYSIWAKTDDTAARDIFGVWVTKADGSGNYLSGVKIATLTNTWTQYSKTFKVTAAMIDGSSTRARLTRFECNTSCTSGKYIYWAAPKVELGNKATTWTPAPEDVQAEIDAKKSVHTLTTNYSYTYAQILTYSGEGNTSHGAWAVTSANGVKVGDTVRLKVTVYDMSNAPVYVIGTVTAVSGNNVTMTSHGLDTTIIDGGNILTNSIGTNQIAANAISIGKLDSSTQTKVNNGDSALTKVNYYNRTCLVGNSSNTQTKYWRKFASYSETRQNSDPFIIFDVMSNGDFSSLKRCGRIKAHIRTTTVGAVEANRETLEWISRSEGIILSDFVLAYKATSGTDVKVELWCRCPASWGGYRFNMVQEGDRTGASSSEMWTLYDSFTADGAESITSGYTQVTSTDIDAARTTATGYITDITSNNGIRIHPSSTENNSIVINSNGMEVFQGGTGNANSVAFFGVADSIQTVATAVAVNEELPTSSSSPLIVSALSQAKSGSDIIVYTDWLDNDSSSIIADTLSFWVKFEKGIASASTDIVYDGNTGFYTTNSKYTIDITRIKYYIDTIPPNIKLGTSTTDSALSIGQLVSNVNRDIFNVSWSGDVTATGDIVTLGGLEVGGDGIYTNGGSVDCGGGDVYCNDLYINNRVIWDHVIDVGTESIWTYRRWTSGIAECWGRVTVASRTYTANGGYYNVTGTPPSGLFVSGSNPVLSATGGITSNVQTEIGYTFASDVNIQTYLINRSTSAVTNTAWVCWHLIGRWK